MLLQFACINGTSSTRAKILNQAYSPESWSKPTRNSVTLVQILSVRQNRFWTSISSSTQGIDNYQSTVVFLFLTLSNGLAALPLEASWGQFCTLKFCMFMLKKYVSSDL